MIATETKQMARWEDYPVVLTVNEVSEILRVGYRTTLKLIDSGEIKAKKVGREYRIPRRLVMEYVGLDPDDLDAEAGSSGRRC